MTAGPLTKTPASLPMTAGPLTKSPVSLPVAAASLTDTTASSSEAAVLLSETSGLLLEPEALRPDPSRSVALQPELDLNPVTCRSSGGGRSRSQLDLNPVCAAWENARDCEAELSNRYADQNSIPGLICGKTEILRLRPRRRTNLEAAPETPNKS